MWKKEVAVFVTPDLLFPGYTLLLSSLSRPLYCFISLFLSNFGLVLYVCVYCIGLSRSSCLSTCMHCVYVVFICSESVSMKVFVYMNVYVCVCVRERERERIAV